MPGISGGKQDAMYACKPVDFTAEQEDFVSAEEMLVCAAEVLWGPVM